MKQETNKIKYFLYARKSSESEDRQVQSIDDQINRLKQVAVSLGLDIKKVYTESKSAKKPNNRPLFDEMINKIEQGEAEGILCWSINRLSRNPIDSGKLSWILQRGVLKAIQTIERQYLPNDNVLLFNVESGMANQYILDLSRDAKRGIDKKLNDGWLPCLAPTGYLNEKENKTIIEDPERFNLVRRMWDLMLTGNYTPPKILDIATKEWGFRTKKYKRMGGGVLSTSGIYRIFSNLFYAGIIEHNGQEYQGKHKTMITLEEYDRVQFLLGRKGKPRLTHKNEFAFTGAIRCGECGCLITAETKKKLIKSTKEIKKYTYYHCTHRKKDYNCTQRKVVKKEDLEAQIKRELDKCTILPDFLKWALEGLSKKNDKEIEDRTKIYEMRHKDLTQAQKELDSLTKMRYRELIDDETFLKEKDELQVKISRMKELLRETEARAEKWVELTENTFKFATYARKSFIEGGLELKKDILKALGQNPVLTRGKLIIEPNEWLKPIINGYPALEKEYLRLEPIKTGNLQAKTELLGSVRARWQGLRESNPRPWFWRPLFYH